MHINLDLMNQTLATHQTVSAQNLQNLAIQAIEAMRLGQREAVLTWKDATGETQNRVAWRVADALGLTPVEKFLVGAAPDVSDYDVDITAVRVHNVSVRVFGCASAEEARARAIKMAKDGDVDDWGEGDCIATAEDVKSDCWTDGHLITAFDPVVID